MPSADSCVAIRRISTSSVLTDTTQASRGKTYHLPRVNAGFIKHTPVVDGGLHGHVPTGPGCTTPHIRFLFVAPRFRIGLPPDPASRRRPCPSPCLRLREHLARGLSPRKRHILPGTHLSHHRREVRASVCMFLFDVAFRLLIPSGDSDVLYR